MRPPTFGTALLMAIIAVFFGSILVSSMSYFVNATSTWLNLRYDVPWISSWGQVSQTVGGWYENIILKGAIIILAAAVAVEIYAAAKNMQG